MRGLRHLRWPLGSIVLLLMMWVAAGAIIYSPEYVMRVLTSRQSSYEDYLHTFPLRTLTASPEPRAFPESPDVDHVSEVFEAAFGVDDLDTFLADTDTQAFIVIKGDTVLYEGYFNETTRDTMLTSFSVAKSVVSILVGIAIDEGFVDSVEDPITAYLPELLERDRRFGAITIKDLLLMSSGLEYQELRWFLFNGDDPLTTYHPDQRDLALRNTNIVDAPGQHFSYNKYHPQLLGIMLERATGMSVSDYTQTRLWDPLGMEYDGAWALDSNGSGFEKMEAGLNARAVDFAKLGRLLLAGGRVNGVQLVSRNWIEESTSLNRGTHNAGYYASSFGPFVYDDGSGYYAYMWYGRLRDGEPADIAAEGDHGQIVYVSPSNDVIVVRNGTGFGISLDEWTTAFFAAASEL